MKLIILLLEMTLILFLGLLESFCKLFNKDINIHIDGLD